MLETIRERAKDNKVIYLFVDNAGYHSKGEVDEAYERLNIVPVFNVGYQYMLNPVERYWSLVKHYYRKVLLEKMAGVNTVCNVNGKGRDDLVDIEILTAAEELPTILQEG